MRGYSDKRESRDNICGQGNCGASEKLIENDLDRVKPVQGLGLATVI